MKTSFPPGARQPSRIARAIRLSREGGKPDKGDPAGRRYRGGRTHGSAPTRARYFPGEDVGYGLFRKAPLKGRVQKLTLLTRLTLVATLILFLLACSRLPELPTTTMTATATAPASVTTPGPVQAYKYQVVRTYPHDPGAYTQGLVFENGRLYESTGLNSQSSLREVDLATGRVLRLLPLASEHFGEGLTVYGDRIIQLTWQSKTGFVYDKKTFELLQTFSYPGEGWGITHDGRRLIMSDGTAALRFLDPDTLDETGRVEVYDQNGPVSKLNELEYVRGEIYANVWQTDYIVRIAPDTGRVVGKIDLKGLLDPASLTRPVDVLNGIAYDPGGDRLFVTGKLWPQLFEIRVIRE